MKNPNGYGSIFKLSGKRRKPWAVRLTVGWNDEGKQEFKYLGYYETRKQAVLALANYNEAPYDLDANRITFSELYKMYLENRKYLSDSNARIHDMCYKMSEELHDIRFAEIRKPHMQSVIDNCDKSRATIIKLRSLYNMMYKYAMENDLVHKNYAQFLEMPKSTNDSKRKPFTNNEINLLWSNIDRYDVADIALIMIYTGLRPGEILTIKNENIFLEERYMVGGFKTSAGSNRIIPIHKDILDLIQNRLNENERYLIRTVDREKMSYVTFKRRWDKMMQDLKINHLPHDCRHTFATLMDNVGANRLSIKKIMGHATSDITDDVYTHKNLEQLLIAIDKIK